MVGIAIELYVDRSFGIPTTLVLHYMQFLPIESNFFFIELKKLVWKMYFDHISSS